MLSLLSQILKSETPDWIHLFTWEKLFFEVQPIILCMKNNQTANTEDIVLQAPFNQGRFVLLNNLPTNFITQGEKERKIFFFLMFGNFSKKFSLMLKKLEIEIPF